MHLGYILFLCVSMTISCVHAQLDKMSASNTTTNTDMQRQDKSAGLPKVEWDILRLTDSSRQNLCFRQTAYCANNCGGPSQTDKNFCNATSMAWNCVCSGKPSYEFPAYLWPIAQTECAGKAQECQMMCTNEETIHLSTCAAACNSYYQCGSERAPPSYLQTENATDEPSYDGPKKIVPTNITVTNTTVNHPDAVASGANHLEHYIVLVPLVASMVVFL